MPQNDRIEEKIDRISEKLAEHGAILSAQREAPAEHKRLGQAYSQDGDLGQKTDGLTAWRWKMTGAIAVVVAVVELLLKADGEVI